MPAIQYIFYKGRGEFRSSPVVCLVLIFFLRAINTQSIVKELFVFIHGGWKETWVFRMLTRWVFAYAEIKG